MSLPDFNDFTVDAVFEGGMLACLRSAMPEAGGTDEDFLAAYRHSHADAVEAHG